jgi:hypothetical protein
MQEVKVHLWDDVHWHEEEARVESTETHWLELDGRRVRLDLTGEHGKELAGQLARWLDAGHPEGEEATARLGFKPGSAEAKQFYARLREWADAEGRSAEYKIRHRDGSTSLGNYKYGRRLVRDYEAYLMAQAA